MGLYKSTPELSGRIGTLWTLSTIKESAVVEFGCMGHTVYARTFLSRMGANGSKLFSTHIRETDIALGDSSRLTKAIAEILEDKEVKTIFLLPSTVPEIIGTDMKALSMELSLDYPTIKFITFPTGSFNMTLNEGIEKTLYTIVKELALQKNKSTTPTYNIVGSCADIYNYNADSIEIKRVLENTFDIKENCTLTSNTSISSIENLAMAHINIVIREEGVKTAKYLEKKFGTPYIYTRPYGFKATLNWLKEISKIINLPLNNDFLNSEEENYFDHVSPYKTMLQRFMFIHKEQSNLIAVGHKDVINGICDYCTQEYNFTDVKKYVDNTYHSNETLEFLSDEAKLSFKTRKKCFLMASEDIIELFDDVGIQISNPDSKWRHPYLPPLVAFRGSVNIGTLLMNEMFKID
ncbi:MAG: nitrogenase component 1 [Lachnospirales bacterium]